MFLAERRELGFTLLELLVVMGLLSVLAGLGIGFLQRGDTSLDQVLSILRAELRGAALTARTHGVPTEVILSPGNEGYPGQLRSRTLVPLATWHLEPGESYLNPNLRPEVRGLDVPAGRFGHAMRPDPDVDAAMFSVPARAFALDQGFVIRLDLKLDGFGPMELLRMGDGLSLELGSDSVPHLRMVQASGSRRGPMVELRGERPVPMGRWFTLEVLHDGRELMLGVDGVESRQPAPHALYQVPGDVLEVSPGGEPVLGMVDEIQLFAYELGEARMILPEVEVLGLQAPIAFGRNGRLGRPVEFQLRSGDLVQTHTVDVGGVVR